MSTWTVVFTIVPVTKLEIPSDDKLTTHFNTFDNTFKHIWQHSQTVEASFGAARKVYFSKKVQNYV